MKRAANTIGEFMSNNLSVVKRVMKSTNINNSTTPPAFYDNRSIETKSAQKVDDALNEAKRDFPNSTIGRAFMPDYVTVGCGFSTPGFGNSFNYVSCKTGGWMITTEPTLAVGNNISVSILNVGVYYYTGGDNQNLEIDDYLINITNSYPGFTCSYNVPGSPVSLMGSGSLARMGLLIGGGMGIGLGSGASFGPEGIYPLYKGYKK